MPSMSKQIHRNITFFEGFTQNGECHVNKLIFLHWIAWSKIVLLTFLALAAGRPLKQPTSRADCETCSLRGSRSSFQGAGGEVGSPPRSCGGLHGANLVSVARPPLRRIRATSPRDQGHCTVHVRPVLGAPPFGCVGVLCTPLARLR